MSKPLRYTAVIPAFRAEPKLLMALRLAADEAGMNLAEYQRALLTAGLGLGEFRTADTRRGPNERRRD